MNEPTPEQTTPPTPEADPLNADRKGGSPLIGWAIAIAAIAIVGFIIFSSVGGI